VGCAVTLEVGGEWNMKDLVGAAYRRICNKASEKSKFAQKMATAMFAET
jgi:hypothetical protein